MVGKCGKIEVGCDLLRMRKEKNRERGRRLENAEKCLIQARMSWKSGRLGNGQILEWKPFLVGFRLEFDGVAGGGITTRVKKYLLHKRIVGVNSISACFLIFLR